jgi:hypothetical protein
MPFLQLVVAIAIGIGIPLFAFTLWLSGRLNWYLGSVCEGLDKIEEICRAIRAKNL